LTPPLAGETIQIYYSRNGGSAVLLNILVKTYGAGKYNFTWEAGKTSAGWKSGLYTLYAQWYGNIFIQKQKVSQFTLKFKK